MVTGAESRKFEVGGRVFIGVGFCYLYPFGVVEDYRDNAGRDSEGFGNSGSLECFQAVAAEERCLRHLGGVNCKAEV